MKNFERGISVLLCTYNGSNRILETLNHLSKQKVRDDLAWEVILIDNASTDNTYTVAKQFAKNNPPFAIRIIQEPRSGKSFAIDTGFGCAQYQYILICDDDNWLDDIYIDLAWNIISANPSIGMLGGQSSGVFETPPPIWFQDFQKYYAVGIQSERTGELSPNKFLWGAGSIINRAAYEILQENGFERIISIETTPRIARGEDVELCLAIRLSGYQLWYDKRLHLQHFMTKERLQWHYLKDLMKIGALMSPVLDIYAKAAVTSPEKMLNNNQWLRYIVKKISKPSFIYNMLLLYLSSPIKDLTTYHQRLVRHYKLLGYIYFNSNFDKKLTMVIQLRKKILEFKLRTKTDHLIHP